MRRPLVSWCGIYDILARVQDIGIGRKRLERSK